MKLPLLSYAIVPLKGARAALFRYLEILNCYYHYETEFLALFLIQNSVNAKYQTIPYPWLVFGEKVKVNAVFIRDSTGVSDSILILFGGVVTKGSMVRCLVLIVFSCNFVFMLPCCLLYGLSFNLYVIGWALEDARWIH